MRRLISLLPIAVLIFLAGCAGTVKNMKEVSDPGVSVKPGQDEAVVVFMRPSGLGFAIQSSVFEAKDASQSLVGIVAAKTKVAYRVAPGKHLFMVIGESADFLAAELVANRTYYVYVSPRMGMWKARFAMEPKRPSELDSSEFKNDYAECRLVEVSADSTRWMNENLASIQSKQAEYYQDWLKKPAAERLQLNPEDGR